MYKHFLRMIDDGSLLFRCSGVEYFIKQCVQDLPNMELIINVRDFPLVSRSSFEN